jgi:hypothetical protein
VESVGGPNAASETSSSAVGFATGAANVSVDSSVSRLDLLARRGVVPLPPRRAHHLVRGGDDTDEVDVALDGDAGPAAAAAADRNRDPIGLRFRAEERGLELVTPLGSFGASLLLLASMAVKQGQHASSSL